MDAVTHASDLVEEAVSDAFVGYTDDVETAETYDRCESDDEPCMSLWGGGYPEV
jgi:hypothetical protein